MNAVALIRRLRQAVTPPGNRGSLESSYRQPNADGPHVSPASVAQKGQQAPPGA